MDRTFRAGSLDHVHLRVPDRDAAVAWYCRHLGFEQIESQRFWAEGIEGGPAQISADGGRTAIAVFQASPFFPAAPLTAGIAFGVDASTFSDFVRSLPGVLEREPGTALEHSDVVDFDLCFAYDFVDPWGTRIEINCYEHDEITRLLASLGVEARRYWPKASFDEWTSAVG